MNTYVLRIHILTNIVNLCGKSVLTRHPDTGLARLPLCQSGIWSTAAGKPKLSTFTLTHYGRSFHYSNVGIHDLCTSQYGNENNRDDSWRGVQLLGDGSWQIVVKDGSETIMCLDW
ncbi:TPA: hypothetical protein ACGH3X_003092 [Salmonella enterica subsp. enterica serovar Montevideo]|nr:hypothetical protein [Salmonella enterica]HCT2162463.1 hypothetical protein [Salmonella enterica subsp. enterica serovar 1,4,[5],12:i:-]HDN9141355.1 hypothetical protein [Salmonella enterica subsp. enterica serovar Typhimurium]HEC7389545.1 hypothetical protein [Salmonella enterica subsp. enterica serovar Newport]HEC9652503.1 hypothetical protein [Salmonella enterica subsp. enterica serovar Ohio]